MEKIGVITGDIVDSREISITIRELLYADLKSFLESLKKSKWIDKFELFRGDSFQCIVKQKEETLKIALMIRLFVKSYITLEQKQKYANYLGKGKVASKGYYPSQLDIRVAIGIGAFDFLNKKTLAHSDGEAFYLSGGGLDEIKTMPYRMVVKTNNIEFTNAIEPSISLMDALIQKWTVNQSETVLLKLEGCKEDEIARQLKISQSAVNQRTKTAQWYAIEKLLVYFNSTQKIN